MGMIDVRRRMLERQPQKKTAQGAVASFTTELAKPVKVLIALAPIQAGSGDPAPDNVRAISGRSSVVVKQSGKNILENKAESGSSNGITWTVNSDGSITFSGTASADVSIFVNSAATPQNIGAGSITIVVPEPSINGVNFQADIYIDGTYISTVQKKAASKSYSGGVITVGMSRIKVNSGTVVPEGTVFYPQIEHGSTATEYEKFTGSDNTASIPTPPGTVYGGEIDCVNGKLKVTMAIVSKKYSELNDGSGTAPTGYSIKSINITSEQGDYSKASNAICNVAKYNASSNAENVFRITSSGNYIYLTLPTTMDADANVDVCYPLATQAEYDLTGLDVITALKGANNIWTGDGDSVTVQYWKY